jgi:Tfp pilus assembly protein PilN
MPTDPTTQWPPTSEEPTVPFHGQATVPSRPPADYPVTAVPYQRPPRSGAVPILSALVVVLLLLLIGVTGYMVSSSNDASKRQQELATQLADEQRHVKELQAQVAAAQAEAERAKQAQSGGSQGTMQQLSSCSDALSSVLKARSMSDFGKAYDAMKSQCKVAGISLF